MSLSHVDRLLYPETSSSLHPAPPADPHRGSPPDALRLALQLRLPTSALLDHILVADERGQAAPAAGGGEGRAGSRSGAELYEKFKAAVNRALLFDVDSSVQRLMEALAGAAGPATAPPLGGAGPQQQASSASASVAATAEEVLSGLVESLQRTQMAAAAASLASGAAVLQPRRAFAPPSQGDLHRGDFMAACRKHLPLLRPLMASAAAPVGPTGGGPAPEGRTLLLRILRALLSLDAPALLRPPLDPGSCSDFVLGAFSALLGDSSRDSMPLRTQAAALLPALLPAAPPGPALGRVVAAVRALVSGTFPQRSASLDPKSAEAGAYGAQLLSTLDGLVQLCRLVGRRVGGWVCPSRCRRGHGRLLPVRAGGCSVQVG